MALKATKARIVHLRIVLLVKMEQNQDLSEPTMSIWSPLKRKTVLLGSAQKTEKKKASALAGVAFEDFCVTPVGFLLKPLIFW